MNSPFILPDYPAQSVQPAAPHPLSPLELLSQDESPSTTDFDAIMADPSAYHWVGPITGLDHKLGEYFTPNPVSRSDRFTKRHWRNCNNLAPVQYTTVWVEMDPLLTPTTHAESARAITEQLTRLFNIVSSGVPEPTAIVMSGDYRERNGVKIEVGKSIHVFWRLINPISSQAWTVLQTLLVDLFDADTFCLNLQAVARRGGAIVTAERFGRTISRFQTILHLGKRIDIEAFTSLYSDTVEEKLLRRHGKFTDSVATCKALNLSHQTACGNLPI